MKKIIFSLIAVLMVAAVDAQVRRGNMITERTKFGVKAGLSSAYWKEEQYGHGIGTYDSKAGIVAGVEAEIPVKNGVYIQPEINYANMGSQLYGPFKNDQTGGTENGVIKFKNDYVQVPVLVKYRPLYTGFAAYIGPQVGLLLQAKENPVGFEPITTTEEYTKFDISGVIGAEYYIPNADDSKPRLGFSGRYIHGFSNIYPSGSTKAKEYFTRNRGFQLTIGVRF